jgi:phosphopantothenoylcysteine decarboxylase / phosphopantothenate---cysteine ligase
VNILVSAGPTREYFDSVRFISNPSSGKMGYALAAEAARRGHRVTLVSGPVSLDPPSGVKVVQVVSAAEMAAACKRAFRTADAAFMTAAVCDYRPRDKAGHKRPKKARALRVVLEPTEDIAAALGRTKGRRLIVAFAMEDNDPHAHAERKLHKKNCDLIVLNGPENVGRDRAEVELFSPGTGWTGPFRGTKAQVARRLVRLAEELRDRRTSGSR